MASSFADQIPVIIHLLQQLAPRSMLDVGKGFGKYGFLAHEYAGVSNSVLPDPARTLAEQSLLSVDAVELQEAYLWPHLGQFYRKVYLGRIEELYLSLPTYDLVLMADVIEHMEKRLALEVVRHFLAKGSALIISTPSRMFDQELYGSEHERHVSHFGANDFRFAPFMDYQNAGAGRIFLLAAEPRRVRGFGHTPRARARRLARLFLAEFR